MQFRIIEIWAVTTEGIFIVRLFDINTIIMALDNNFDIITILWLIVQYDTFDKWQREIYRLIICSLNVCRDYYLIFIDWWIAQLDF